MPEEECLGNRMKGGVAGTASLIGSSTVNTLRISKGDSLVVLSYLEWHRRPLKLSTLKKVRERV